MVELRCRVRWCRTVVNVGRQPGYKGKKRSRGDTGMSWGAQEKKMIYVPKKYYTNSINMTHLGQSKHKLDLVLIYQL